MHEKPEAARRFRKNLGVNLPQEHFSAFNKNAFEETIKKATKVDVEEKAVEGEFIEMKQHTKADTILDLKYFRGVEGSKRKESLQALNHHLLQEAIATLDTMYPFNSRYYHYLIDFDLPPDSILTAPEYSNQSGAFHFQLKNNQATLSLVSSVRILNIVNESKFYHYNAKHDADKDLLKAFNGSKSPSFDFTLPILCRVECMGVIDFDQLDHSYVELRVYPKHPQLKYHPSDSSYWSEITDIQSARPPQARLSPVEQDRTSHYSDSSSACCCLWMYAFRRRRSSMISAAENYGTIATKPMVMMHDNYQQTIASTLDSHVSVPQTRNSLARPSISGL